MKLETGFRFENGSDAEQDSEEADDDSDEDFFEDPDSGSSDEDDDNDDEDDADADFPDLLPPVPAFNGAHFLLLLLLLVGF